MSARRILSSGSSLSGQDSCYRSRILGAKKRSTSLKALREERDQLVATNNAQYETYSFARSKLYELQAIHQNLSTYIKEKTLEKNQEQSQERS